MAWLWQICIILTLTSCAYTLFAAGAVRNFAQRAGRRAHDAPDVTILKPLYGGEPRLFGNIESFCRQNYRGKVQIVCGVQQHSDAVPIDIVRRLAAKLPEVDIALVIDDSEHGSNRKVSNLINMMAKAKHDIIVLADSDMVVDGDYLDRVVGALGEDGAGAVTCLYRGEAVAGFWSRLSAAAIDFHFLPNVVTGVTLGLATPCFGSTIALRRSTLEAIGGFQRIANHLADDYALGEAVRASGLKIAIPPQAIAHCCSEESFAALIRHEMRWARTIALVDPKGFAGSVLTHAFLLSILALCFSGFTAGGGVLVILALASRLILQINIARSFALPRPQYLLGPLRDLLSFGVFLACFFTRAVDWRGQRYVVNADGTMTTSEKMGS